MKIPFIGTYIFACTQPKWPNQVGSLNFWRASLQFLQSWTPLPSLKSDVIYERSLGHRCRAEVSSIMNHVGTNSTLCNIKVVFRCKTLHCTTKKTLETHSNIIYLCDEPRGLGQRTKITILKLGTFMHQIDKGGLLLEGIFNLVPFSKRYTKSLSLNIEKLRNSDLEHFFEDEN